MSTPHTKNKQSTTDLSADFSATGVSEIYSEVTTPNHYNVVRAPFKTIPPCPLQPPPDLKTYKEIRAKKTRGLHARNDSSVYSASVMSSTSGVTAESLQNQEKEEILKRELSYEFDGKSYPVKIDEKYLIYSNRELEDLKRIVVMLLEHCPQSFNILFDSKNALNTSKGILAMTASTQTTLVFIKKIMNIEFDDNAGTDRLMKPNCPTNMLCQSLFEAIFPDAFLSQMKQFFADFSKNRDSFEIDDLLVENEDDIEQNYMNLQKWAIKFIQIVTNSLPTLPTTIFQICQIYRQLILSHLTHLSRRDADIMTLSFLSQNCFLSLLENPDRYRLLKGMKKLPFVVQRNFIVLSQVLRVLFNGEQFSSTKLGYMTPLNPFISNVFSLFFSEALPYINNDNMTTSVLKENRLIDARAIASVHKEFSLQANVLLSSLQGFYRVIFLENMLDLGSYQRKCSYLNAFTLDQVKLFRKEIAKQRMDCYYIMRGTVLVSKKKDKNEAISYEKVDKKDATVVGCFTTEDYLTFIDLKGNSVVKRVYNRHVNTIHLVDTNDQHIMIDTPKQTIFITGDNLSLFLVYLLRGFAHGYYRKPSFSIKANPSVMARILPYPLNHKKQSGGFLGVYKAFCASFGVRMNNALVFDITNDINIQTVGEEFTLDLSKYYNDDYNNTNEDSLLDTDMQPIFGALCDNRYFKKLVIKDVNLRKCYSKLKEIMSTNVTIESLSLINVSLGSKWSEVMDGYNYNPRHAIKHLDVSNNQMDSKGISAIGSLIRCFRLESLNMSNVLVKSQLFSAFLDDLRKTKGSIPLRSLNISGAHLYYTQVEFLCSLIKATLPFLSVLIMRNCEVPKEASLMKCVTVLQTIIKLDITGINFTQDQTRELVKPLGTRMSEITEIQFEGAVVDKTVLRKFIEDVPAHGVTLNLAHSSLNTEIMTSFAHMFSGLTSIRRIDVSDTDIGNEGIARLCESLIQNTVVEELNVSGAFGKNDKKKDSEMVVKSICNLLVSGCPLKILRMAGGKKDSSKLGISILRIFEVLSNQNTLELLDVSRHGFGNQGAFALSNTIRSNSKLNELIWDENGVGISGMRAVALKLKHNITLLNFQIPIMDCGALQGKDLMEARTIINDMLTSSN